MTSSLGNFSEQHAGGEEEANGKGEKPSLAFHVQSVREVSALGLSLRHSLSTT